jgi:hypothetical protein
MASVADDFRIANRDGAPGTIVSLPFSLAKTARPSHPPRGVALLPG